MWTRRRESRGPAGLAASIVAAWHALPTPLARYRWVLLLAALTSATLLVPLLLMSDAGPAVRWAAVAALAALVGWWIWGYRRRRFPLAGLLAEGVALALVGIGTGDPQRLLGLLYTSLFFRILHARGSQLLALPVVWLAALSGAAVVAQAAGGQRTVDLVGHAIGLAQNTVMLTFLKRALTQQEDAETTLRAARERAEQIAGTLAEVGGGADLHQATEALLRGALTLLGSAKAIARVFDPQTHAYQIHLSLSRDGTVVEPDTSRPPRPGSHSASVEFGGPSVLVQDYATVDPRDYPYVKDRLDEGVRTTIHVPIDAGGQRIGILHVNHTRPHAFTAEHLAVAEMLGLQAGAAIDRARLATARSQAEQELQAVNRQLRDALHDAQRTHAELQVAQQHVIEQERLRALGEMASGIAHDFNNTLAPIVGFSELLLGVPGALEDRQRARRYLDIIHTAGQDAAHVVSRLREFYRAREETDALAPLDVAALAEQAISLTKPKWKDQALAHGAHLQILTELQPVPAILGNAAELREALTNLIFNAVDAMPVGGTITVRTRASRSRVVLEVADSGTGMTEAVRQRCLEPFFTTKGEQGTGLGLAMVYGIVQRHGGAMAIESAPGAGTTFRMTFAAHAGESGADGRSDMQPPVSLRVLVADDDPLVREVTVQFLIALGHAASAVADGSAALEAVTHGDTAPFDLLVTDRAMPGMSGDQLAAALRGLGQRLPIVLLTGYGTLMRAAGERPPGVDAVIPKPVTLAALGAAISAVAHGGRRAPRPTA